MHLGGKKPPQINQCLTCWILQKYTQKLFWVWNYSQTSISTIWNKIENIYWWLWLNNFPWIGLQIGINCPFKFWYCSFAKRFSHSVWFQFNSHVILLAIFSHSYFCNMLDVHQAAGFSASWSKSTLRVLWVASEWSSCTLATDIIFRPPSSLPQLSEIKKALLSFMYNVAFNMGHTQSQLWVYGFSVAFSFSQSLICQFLFPQVSVFLYMPTLSVYVFLAFFISLSVSASSLCPSLSRSLSVSAWRNTAITLWPLTWLAIHSMCFNSLWTKKKSFHLLVLFGAVPLCQIRPQTR